VSESLHLRARKAALNSGLLILQFGEADWPVL
jgi:hypothetical protein